MNATWASAKAVDVEEKDLRKEDSNLLIKIRRQLLKTMKKSDVEGFKVAVQELQREFEPKSIKTLMDIKDNRGWTLLHESCRSKISTFSSMIIDLGADVNSLTSELSTPLVVAAYNGRTQVAQEVIRAGALLDLRDSENKTALDIARERGKTQIIEIILNNSAQKDCSSSEASATKVEDSKRIKLQ